MKITQASGTVYRFTWHDAGTFTIIAGDGRVAYRQAGLRTFTGLIDTKGNLDLDDDVFLSGEDSVKGHFPTANFCADLANFTS